MGESKKRVRLGEGDLKKFIRRIDSLPALPTVVAHVNEIVESPTASASDINNAIRRDVALSARILKLVNSSFYGFPRKISSITHAVVILGLPTVRNVVLSAFVLDAFSGKGLPFGHREFWIHSLGVGAAANALAKRRRLAETEDAFVAGLLHDVGKIVLHQYARADFNDALRIVAERDCLLYDAEREVMATSHAEIGSLLLDTWHLPSHLVESVALHHTPDVATQSPDLTAVVHVADILTRALLVGSGGDLRIPRASHAAWTRIGVAVGEVDDLVREIAGEVRKIDAFIELI